MQTNHIKMQVTQVFTTIYNTTVIQKPYLLVKRSFGFFSFATQNSFKLKVSILLERQKTSEYNPRWKYNPHKTNRCMKVREFILYAKMADTIYSMSTTNSRVSLHDFKLHLDTQETLLKPIQLKHAVSYRY